MFLKHPSACLIPSGNPTFHLIVWAKSYGSRTIHFFSFSLKSQVIVVFWCKRLSLGAMSGQVICWVSTPLSTVTQITVHRGQKARVFFVWYFLISGLKHPKVEEQWSIFRHIMKSCQFFLTESLFGFVKLIVSKARTQHCVSVAFWNISKQRLSSRDKWKFACFLYSLIWVG